MVWKMSDRDILSRFGAGGQKGVNPTVDMLRVTGPFSHVMNRDIVSLFG